MMEIVSTEMKTKSVTIFFDCISRLPPGVVSQIQLTLRFSSQRQKLIVVVHKAR